MYRQRSIAVPEVVCCCESSGGQILRHETGVALRLAWYQSVCLSIRVHTPPIQLPFHIILALQTGQSLYSPIRTL